MWIKPFFGPKRLKKETLWIKGRKQPFYPQGFGRIFRKKVEKRCIYPQFF